MMNCLYMPLCGSVSKKTSHASKNYNIKCHCVCVCVCCTRECFVVLYLSCFACHWFAHLFLIRARASLSLSLVLATHVSPPIEIIYAIGATPRCNRQHSSDGIWILVRVNVNGQVTLAIGEPRPSSIWRYSCTNNNNHHHRRRHHQWLCVGVYCRVLQLISTAIFRFSPLIWFDWFVLFISIDFLLCCCF